MPSRPAPITVAIARFEDIVNRGLRSLIEEDRHLQLVAADLTGELLAGTLADRRPQVAILNLGSMHSPVQLRYLHERSPQTCLVVLANDPSAEQCRQLLALGATACLAKSIEARDLLHAIHLASRGLRVLPSGPGRTELGGEPELLTAREADVLELLADGRSNPEIAATLQVGLETVRTHTRHIYRKLGVKTRRELRARR
jgi:DNA-binding NarL/FixJ family response regulator